MNEEFKKPFCELRCFQEFNNIITNRAINYDFISEEGFCLLHVACLTGMIDICKLLVRKTAFYLNSTDYYGRSPLMFACGAGFFDITHFLIDAGADPNICDVFGYNALLMAVLSGNRNLVNYLMEVTKFQGASDYLGNITALTLASSLGKTDIIAAILKSSININVQTKFSDLTPLMLAICGGHTSAVKVLLDWKPCLNLKSHLLITAAEYASLLRQPDIHSLFRTKFFLDTLSVESIVSSPRKRNLILSQNSFLSPIRKASSPKRCITWIKKSLKVRSRSLESRNNLKYTEDKIVDQKENVMEYILISSNLSQYWPIFKEHEINFKMFLSMNDEDLCSVGIKKESARNKIINLIHHYNKIFHL